MPTMTPRERLLKTLRHEEPDRVPYDLAGCHVTGIARIAYDRLRSYLGLEPREPIWADVIQQVVIPHEDVYERLEIDTRGLFPLTSHNWDVEKKLVDTGENWKYRDEWELIHYFPKKNGRWFSVAFHPMADIEPQPETVRRFNWPDPTDPARFRGLAEKARAIQDAGYPTMIKGLCAGLFEMAQRLRGMENAMVDPLLHPDFFESLIDKLTDLKIAFWNKALAEAGPWTDVVVEADDYGTQSSQLISPDQFRSLFKPRLSRLLGAIRKAAPDAKIFFHSCGNVRPILPDFIEMGVDILNPVHITAEGMEPAALKKDFGDTLCFWGGGVETQSVLPKKTPAEIKENVRRNIEALAPGGGFVFNTVHNIQADVPPENIMAMWEALREYGAY